MSIPQPQKDEQGKIVGDFYPLQRAELIALRKNKLINNAAYVHLALRYENPYCDRPIEIFPKEFALRWQMPESSVYEAIGKLKEASVFEIKSGKVVIEWVKDSQQEEVIDSQQDKDSGNPESLRKPRKNSGFSETVLDCQKRFQDPRNNSEIPEEDIYKDRARDQTIQTFPDFLKSLSDSEREKFEKFWKKKMAELPTKPTLPSRWMEKNFESLYSQFQEEESYCKAVNEQIQATQSQATLKETETTRYQIPVPTASQCNEIWQKFKKAGRPKKDYADIESRARSLGYTVTEKGIFEKPQDPNLDNSSGRGFKPNKT